VRVYGTLAVIAVASGIASFAAPARAERLADRAIVRYVTPETGGNARPGYISERELAFHTRIEALIDQTPLAVGEYPERYVRVATDRMVARRMLASLMIQRGIEPPDLARAASESRAELEVRVGGAHVLEDTMKKEGIDEAELIAFLRDEVRATHYVDRAIAPILAVTEDSLREAYRGAFHPFRGQKFDDARPRLARWLVVERLRAAEIEFLQGARARIKITSVGPGRSAAPEGPR
jgi:hypothetical protein